MHWWYIVFFLMSANTFWNYLLPHDIHLTVKCRLRQKIQIQNSITIFLEFICCMRGLCLLCLFLKALTCSFNVLFPTMCATDFLQHQYRIEKCWGDVQLSINTCQLYRGHMQTSSLSPLSLPFELPKDISLPDLLC